MKSAFEPRIDVWMAHLRDGARERGHAVEARRSRRNGSTYWSIDGSRALCAHDAARRMERIVYGREYP